LPGVLERFPRHLEEEALLGIHGHAFARRDAEEIGIEAVDPLEEPAPAGVHLARRTRIRVVVRVYVPAVGRDLADGVHAVAQEVPVGLRLAGSPGEAAADPDDRDGLRPRALDGIEL
jgi:hypothetical protein